ncbi:hypothetical protein SK128_017192 [Halocaridina rubra]|uniref:C3H1-type domain-containing protein n=1 Tax=Halocaridina rubra TaxID=373956 RepID=A0AAN8WGG9_HALRR
MPGLHSKDSNGNNGRVPPFLRNNGFCVPRGNEDAWMASQDSFESTRRRGNRRLETHTADPVPLRYKTELCRAYDEGVTCKFGSACTFAHGFSELRPVPRHPKYKTDQCRTFHSVGYCSYGVRCHFIHNPEEAFGISPTHAYVMRNRRNDIAKILSQASGEDSNALLANLRQLSALHMIPASGIEALMDGNPPRVNMDMFNGGLPRVYAQDPKALLSQFQAIALDGSSTSKNDPGISVENRKSGCFNTSYDFSKEVSMDGSVDLSMQKSSDINTTWCTSSLIGSPPKESWDDIGSVNPLLDTPESLFTSKDMISFFSVQKQLSKRELSDEGIHSAETSDAATENHV